MSEQRNERHSRDGEGFGGRRNEEQERRYRDEHGGEHERTAAGFGRGGADRRGSEGFGGYGGGGGSDYGGRGEQRGRMGEEDYRDYGRGQPGGAYEHAGERGYRHGGGYGGYGQQPGEAGGGFGSGRSYASEPGWGPGYGDEGRGGRGYEAQGGFPGAYGAQQGGYGRQGGQGYGGRGSYAREQYAHGRELGGYGGWTRGQGSYGQSPSGQAFDQGQHGQRFGESGHTYGEQGFGQSRDGYGQEFARQRRQARGPKGYQRSDERLKDDICERLMNADHIDASDVSLEVKGGKVTLEGTVPQRRMKHAIEDIVDDCIGVKDIENKVRVSSGEEGRSETKTSIGSSQSSSGRA